MLLLESQLPINLEVLDAGGGVLSGMAATLAHLDGEWASIALYPDDPPACLHWGARVRFQLGKGTTSYEVTGVVVAHDMRRSAAAEEETTHSEPHEVRIRLTECRPRPQRRSGPRRRTRFAVSYRPISAAGGMEPEWRRAWCVDVSASGMRLRADRIDPMPERLQLEFTLPSGKAATSAPRLFRVRGHLLRVEVSRRCAENIEMAVKFERLSVEDGRELSAFVEYWSALSPAKAAA